MGMLRQLGLRPRPLNGEEPKWICGRVGKPCRNGPGLMGRCRTRFECTPAKTATSWACRRPAAEGGACKDGPLPDGTCCNGVEPCRPVKTLRTRREIASLWAVVFFAGLVTLAIAYAGDTSHFMPGPITTSHSNLGQCSDCHSNIAQGRFGWLHAVFTPANPQKDSAACLTCHKMSKTALNPHGADKALLEAYTRRLVSTPAAAELPVEARLRNAVLPTANTFPDGVYCATCHKEHKGGNIDLKAMPDAQCQTCHSVQFASFNQDHPAFENYPFRRRTRINFDHSSHFKKHFPEWRAKKGKLDEVPGACSGCHTASAQNGHMNVKPFEEVCSACHLGQIVGVERATGPKGIALLTLPGLDVLTLNEKKARIGEWPEESESEISPLMKLLIGRDEERRKMLEVTGKLDLLDLTEATPEEIAQVEKLAWEVKSLLHALTTAQTADVFKRLTLTTGAALDRDLVAKLTASLPRDVLIAAQRQWLPHLAAEVVQAAGGSPGLPPVKSEPEPEPEVAKAEEPEKKKPPAKPLRLGPNGSASWRIDPFGRLIKGNAAPEPDEAEETDDPETGAADAGADAASDPAEATSSDAAEPAAEAEPEPVELDLDAESWAASGGWYRKDFAILYKPTGHADPFMHAWLDLTARLVSDRQGNLATPAFAALSDKDAQGQCTKCHSVDAAADKSRIMNWMPSSLATRDILFTRFDHEPHFGIVKEKGCLTCHETSNAKDYQETYKGNDPFVFRSNFKQVKKETCAECHNKTQARDDCTLCHKYHVNGVSAPITFTRIPEK